MEETENKVKKLPNQEIDYFKIGKILVSRWYWVAGSLLIFLVWSYVYLWYTPKTYATAGTMKLEDKKSEIPDMAGVVAPVDRSVSRIQSETSIIQSQTVLLNAIRDLNYPVSFYIEGRVRTSELYPQKPLDVQLIQFDSLNFYHDIITFKPVNTNSFKLTYKNAGKDKTDQHNFNSPITIGSTTFVIKKPGNVSYNTVYLFKFNTPEELLGRVRSGLRTSELAKNSNIILLQQTDANPQFAADVLNNIMKEYLVYDRSRKTQSATQMINFIDDQLKFLSNQVKSSDKQISDFKQKNRLMEVSTSAEAALVKAKDLETQQALLKLQLLAIDQLKNQIAKEQNNVTLNFNLGDEKIDPSLPVIVEKLDKLLNQRYELLKTYNLNSQPIQDINNLILQAKTAALNSVNATYSNVKRSYDYLTGQLAGVNKQLSVLPVAEREQISLNRDNEVSDKVYSFLSEKKLSAQISRAGILPGASIVEQAQPNFNPVSPDEHSVRRSAIVFGILTGLGLIVLIRVLNPYIYDKETVESLTTVPIIGVIRKFPNKINDSNSQLLALSMPKSMFAESVRSVRTNLSFIASEKNSKVICITSEVAGEGKSFVAVNLSSTLSLIDKKVILIAADLRRSRLHHTFNVPNNEGLSTYLSRQSDLDNIILHSEQANLDFIVSGPVPPNPSELLHSTRMKELIEDLKQRYDIIMIDTAPVGLVSDSVPLIRISDINIFVIRSGKSKYYAATIPQRIAQEYHLDNSVIVLNAFTEDLLHSRYYTTRFTGDGYGHYYYYSDYSGYEKSGYYMDDERKKRWWDVTSWFRK
ncbi:MULTISPECIES: GumC family protein [unclassified Mucilaginibacter]|uniref:GumC family protein n=1 Tax=unclassified Mucilaginibacter TaxID=2617802 RepID=UPI00095A0944|nr:MULTISPECIES: tyrosine-protein kinase family protein [unclassified Mucilaginibacter]OJW15055.1 MAG: tyrosine protein kinase [Mucilaginibacter sp. 44-25]PLW89674.1 MAG: tyrosine protein kinase [Mucilaginibacter sp.]PMP65170.1 MAG: tyrosine protein kinase [Mucilaginibacter sp.]HEK21151.1 polysaccharide biosynthesis tyrosine autokinase [Bacteroidota bacterium]